MSESNSQRRTEAPQVALQESRESGRRLGCIGVSIVAHCALLTALAVVPETVRQIGGGNTAPEGAGSGTEMSIVELSPSSDSAAAAVNAATETQPLTDESSEVALPSKTKPTELAKTETPPIAVEKSVEPVTALPEKKSPVKPAAAKPVEKAQPQTLPAKAAPIMTSNEPEAVAQPVEDQPAEEKSEETPVMAAVAPQPTEIQQPEEQKGEESGSDTAPAPVLVAEQPVEQPQEEPAPQPTPAPKDEDTTPIAAAVAPVQTESAKSEQPAEAASEKTDDSSAGAAPIAAAASGMGDEKEGQGSSDDVQKTGAGSAATIVGPIRDASELRALPGNPNPVYPARDRLARKEGTSVILGRVGADGRVTEIAIERSSGSRQMDTASAQAFRSWRFQAGQQGWVRKPFQFRLVGEAKEVPAPLGKQLRR